MKIHTSHIQGPVMLKSCFYYYLHLLTQLLIKQQIQAALLKCKGTLELQNCCSAKQEVLEYKEPSSIDYMYYCIDFSLHFSLHWIMRAAVIK